MKRYYYLKTSQKNILVSLIHYVCNFKWKICHFKTYFIWFKIALHGWHKSNNFLVHLDHSISYDMLCQTETAQAELSQEFLKTANMLPLEPDYEVGQIRSLC